MRCTVRFHEAAADDIRRYRSHIRRNETSVDLTALVDEQIMELKRLLARTGGHFNQARMIRPGPQPGVDGVFELEYVSGAVWVEFSRERKGRSQTLITVLRWRLRPYSA